MQTQKLAPIHGDWTGADVREYLPDVRVSLDGRIVDCMTCGRLNQFATVFVHGYATSWTFSWDAIAHSINTGSPLQGGR